MSPLPIVSLATELTGGKGSTIRILEHGTFDLKVLSSYGLSQQYLKSGAIDHGKSITEILQGDIIIINDFENDPRVEDLDAAKKEGVSSVIGIPFTVNETTYSILRVYFPSKKIPTHEEMELLNSLGKLSCLAIDRAVGGFTGHLGPAVTIQVVHHELSIVLAFTDIDSQIYAPHVCAVQLVGIEDGCPGDTGKRVIPSA